MFGFLNKKSKCAKRKLRESPEIAKARKYLESTHPTHYVMRDEEPFHYVETSQKGDYKRYHFYQGYDKRLIYIVLSDEERNEIKKIFEEKMGNEYVYKDTILCGMTGNVVQHRFYRPKSYNTSITFMNDEGKIWGGNFAMDEDMLE